MGPSLLALSDDIGAAALAVGGGDLLLFSVGNPTIQPMMPLLAQIAGSAAGRSHCSPPRLLDPADPNTFSTRCSSVVSAARTRTQRLDVRVDL